MSGVLRVLVLLAIAVFLHEDGAPAQKVIIFGAGPSGLAAAARLVQNHGFKESQITILEAENRYGGRINTITHGDGVLDLGAAYCHGTNNIVYKLVNPTGLLNNSLHTEESFGSADNVQVAYPDTGKILSHGQWEQYRKVADQILKSALKDLQSSTSPSLGAYFNGAFPKFIPSLNLLDSATAWDLTDWDDRTQGIETPAPNWLDISGYGYANYDNIQGDGDITWAKGHGYSSLFPILLKNVNIDAMIVYNALVTSIQWKPDGDTNTQVIVTTSNGQNYQADVVLVTVSLGVLKQQAATMFNPPLPPAKTKAIQYLGFGTIDKLILEFDEPWWDRNYWGGVNFLTAPEKRTNTWTSRLNGFYTMTYQPNLLIGWVTGSDVSSFETMPESELLSICSKMLKGAIGNEFINYTEPIGVIRSTWHSNQHFQGSYSYRSMASDTNNVWPGDLPEPEQDDNDKYRLLFSGEATQEGHHYSTVHAAIDTGYKQADNIATYSY